MPFADSNGVRLYYEVHGEGEPLLLHPGFGSTVEIYWANTPELSKHFRVIVFDPRGAGRSDTPEAGWTMDTYADDCAAVLDAVGAGSAHALGTSFGGMVVQNLAILHPARVRGLVLACTTPGGPHHVMPPPENVARFLTASEVGDPGEAVRMRYPLHYSDAYIAEHDGEIVARAIAEQHLGSQPAGRAGQLAAVGTHDTHDRLRQIASPTMVAHGDEDGIIPVENASVMARQIPRSTERIYPGAKHIFFIECAAEFNADIASFLQRVGPVAAR
jgi:pimeloyl-ACP methyl ester carboxylesterase